LGEGLTRKRVAGFLRKSVETIYNIEKGRTKSYESTWLEIDDLMEGRHPAYPAPRADTPLPAPETRLVPGQAPVETPETITSLLREWHCDVRYFCEVFADSGIPDTAKFRKFAFWIDNAHGELHKSGLFPDSLCQKATP